MSSPKSCKYEPVFIDIIIAWALHSNIHLKTARVRKPRDKLHVVNEVKIIHARIFAPLRNKVYHSIEELNKAVLQFLQQYNKRPFQQKITTGPIILRKVIVPAAILRPGTLYHEVYHRLNVAPSLVRINTSTVSLCLCRQKDVYHLRYRYRRNPLPTSVHCPHRSSYKRYSYSSKP